MDLASIGNLISSVGFPIAVAVGIAIWMYKYQKETNAAIKELTKAVADLTTVVTIINEKWKWSHDN